MKARASDITPLVWLVCVLVDCGVEYCDVRDEKVTFIGDYADVCYKGGEGCGDYRCYD